MISSTAIRFAQQTSKKIKPATRKKIFLGLVLAVIATRRWKFLPALAALKGWKLPLDAFNSLRRNGRHKAPAGTRAHAKTVRARRAHTAGHAPAKRRAHHAQKAA